METRIELKQEWETVEELSSYLDDLSLLIKTMRFLKSPPTNWYLRAEPIDKNDEDTEYRIYFSHQ